MYTYFHYKDREILIDNQRYYVLHGWQKESYAGGKEHIVPLIDFEISENDHDEYLKFKMQHLREKKLKRIFEKPE